MAGTGHWTVAPLRSYQGWRSNAARTRQLHWVLYFVWCLLGTPFYFIACLGAALCTLLFPAMLLGLGLDVVHKHPGLGWAVYAAAVTLLWVTLLVVEFVEVARQLRARTLDIEAIAVVLLMLLAVAVAGWYVHYELAA
jgi:hypothetical protein